MFKINRLKPVKFPRPRPLRFILLVVCLFAFFWRLGAAPLFDLDEALYVDCARQMLLTGDWVTPRLNSRPPHNPASQTVPFYEKPILVYWTSAISQKIFGLHLLAARLPAALAALLATALIAGFGIRRFGERAGLLAGIVYAASPLTILDARQMTTDGLLTLWISGALLAFAALTIPPPRNTENNKNNRNTSPDTETAEPSIARAILFWIFCALAVLTKGIVGILLPMLIIGIFVFADSWVNRTDSTALTLIQGLPAALWQTMRRLRPLMGLALFFLIALPWHVLAARTGERDAQNRTFYQEYVIRQHVNRFRGGKNGDTVHAASPFMYVIYFAVGFFPWAFFAPAAFKNLNHRDEEKKKEEVKSGTQDDEAKRRLRRLLLAWFGTVFVFFSIGAAKLPTYIAPLFPPAALLVGVWLDAVLRGANRRQAVLGTLGAVMMAGLLFAAALLAPRFLPPNLSVPANAIRLAQTITALLFLGPLIALIGFARKNSVAGIVALLLTVLTVVGVGATAGYNFAAREGFGPYQRLARQANAYAARNIPIVYYDIVPRQPSMLYRAAYSPREFSRAPLLPYLRTFLTPNQPAAIIICSRKTLDSKLHPELGASPDFIAEILAQDGAPGGGWILLRVTRQFTK